MVRNKNKIIRSVTVPQSIGFFEDVIMQMDKDGYETVVITSPGKELEAFRQRHPKEKVIEVSMARHISLTKDFKSLWEMMMVMYKEKPYMVHSMTPKAGLITMIAAWLTGVPVRIHTFTGLVWPTATGLKRRILMATDWLTCACATHIIPEGKGVMDDLQKHITKKPMRVLGYGNVRGVDMEYWNKENADAEKVRQIGDDDKFTFLFVGRIVKDKGIDELVEAFMRLRKESKVRLLLVGRFEDNLDPVSDATRMLIEECEDIICTGPQYGKDLLAYYAASDCFVFPSYREGFPNTVLEAGAMELPSIVTDINGSREIIENGKNGIVIPSKDTAALAEAMKNMVEDVQMRKRMAENARPMIGSRFEQGFVRKCLFDFYDEIMI